MVEALHTEFAGVLCFYRSSVGRLSHFARFGCVCGSHLTVGSVTDINILS